MIRRGEIYLADLGNVRHTDIGKIRPVLIFQNDYLNRMVDDGLYGEVIIVPLSSTSAVSDFTIQLAPRDRLRKQSTILCHAVKMIATKRLLTDRGLLTRLSEHELKQVERRVLYAMGVPS